MLQDFFNNKNIILNFFNEIVHNTIFIDQCLDLRLDTNNEKGGFPKLTFKIRKTLTSISRKDNFFKKIYVYPLKTEVINFLK